MSVAFGTVTGRLVHPTAPVQLTKSGPLGTRCNPKQEKSAPTRLFDVRRRLMVGLSVRRRTEICRRFITSFRRKNGRPRTSGRILAD